MKVDYCILGVVNACALRGVVDDIDEVGIIGLFDGGRNGEATHAKEAEVCCYHSGTDGAVSGFGIGFDVDDGFHNLLGFRHPARMARCGFRLSYWYDFRDPFYKVEVTVRPRVVDFVFCIILWRIDRVDKLDDFEMTLVYQEMDGRDGEIRCDSCEGFHAWH